MNASITVGGGRRKAPRRACHCAAKTNGMLTGVDPEEGGNFQVLMRDAMQLDRPG
jgi:hypothetical protein